MSRQRVGWWVSGRALVPVVGATMLAAVVSAGIWGWAGRSVTTHLYTASGYGGYVGVNRKPVTDTPIQRASDAYAAGRYAEAETISDEIVRTGARPPTPQFWGTARADGGGVSTGRAGLRPAPPQLWRGPRTDDSGRSGPSGDGGQVTSSPHHLIKESPDSGTRSVPATLGSSPSHDSLLARRILAYSSARQGKFAEAKARFEELRQAAYESPDHGEQRVAIGEAAPTLEEEGAFQEAVCTSALGDKRAAEAEFDAFLRSYPRSILVHGAVKRIARYHGGNVPKDAEDLWKQAMAVQKAADEAQKREQALCGPECLAEMLRRGVVSHEGTKTLRNSMQEPVDVRQLAQEMNTSGDGTSVAAMVRTAAKHGLRLEGVSLTMKGLAEQKLPIIALVAPGHYVIVEAVSLSPTHPLTSAKVAVWDPDAKGTGAADRRTFSATEWAKAWEGVALR